MMNDCDPLHSETFERIPMIEFPCKTIKDRYTIIGKVGEGKYGYGYLCG